MWTEFGLCWPVVAANMGFVRVTLARIKSISALPEIGTYSSSFPEVAEYCQMRDRFEQACLNSENSCPDGPNVDPAWLKLAEI